MHENSVVYSRVEQDVLPGLETYRPLTDYELHEALATVDAFAKEVRRNYDNENGATPETKLEILPTLAQASSRVDGLFAEATNRGIIKVEN